MRIVNNFCFSGCNKILTGSHGLIQSPNYPSDYPPSVDCTWTIIPPPQYSNIAVTFHHIDMQDSLQCRYVNLTVCKLKRPMVSKRPQFFNCLQFCSQWRLYRCWRQHRNPKRWKTVRGIQDNQDNSSGLERGQSTFSQWH